MSFDLTSNQDEVTRKLRHIAEKALPFAARDALNKTALKVLFAEKAEMSRAFDRPIPWTLNSFIVVEATETNLVAVVKQKESADTRDYLKRQAEGGPRRNTGFEGQIKFHWPGLASWQGLVPASGAMLDQYGNWNKGQMTAVMAALGAMRDKASNQTKVSRATQKANRARAQYYKLLGLPVPKDAQQRAIWEQKISTADKGGRRYFIPKEGDKLKQAVYSRNSGGQLNVILALAMKPPTYAPRFNFQQVAEATTTANFSKLFFNALAKNIAMGR
jgi:hypothetical protein